MSKVTVTAKHMQSAPSSSYATPSELPISFLNLIQIGFQQRFLFALESVKITIITDLHPS